MILALVASAALVQAAPAKPSEPSRPPAASPGKPSEKQKPPAASPSDQVPAGSSAAGQAPAAKPGGAPPAPAAPAVPAPAAADPPAAGSGDYEVGPGDVLDIAVFGNDDLSRIPTVQTNGSISFPLLGEVQVAGLTVAEVQRKVTNLLAKDYLVNPQVEVKVKEYQSQFVSVVGEVNSPGRKAIRGRMRLIDALLESGGFKGSSSGEVLITRSDGAFDDGRRSITVRISSAATLQDQINLELALRNGDIITALPKSYVTVDGEVNRPGRYAIESDLTVTGAVSLAGGLTRFGSSDVKLRRTDPQSGKISIIEVDLKAVRNGKKPDVPLLPNDVVSVSRRVL
jgi:polysaccharide export outer membrane protein